jgi:hypothetical protein
LKDRVGEVYLSMGGLLAGAGLGTLFAALFAPPPVWGIILVGVITLIGFYLMLAVLLDWRLPGRRSSLQYVIEKARELSASIAMWAGERSRLTYDSLPRAETWDADTQRMIRQHGDTIIRYNEKFAVDALVAFDQLVAHGADPDTASWGGRHLFENPNNQQGIEEVGRTLGIMAAQLEYKFLTSR